ncbi:hypothetical protein [Bacillus alveayuensis]|jgi:hypothetical protein|uniref:hypothetical protein n=1 Tax=Aeribacillus alveayuensis TaxID=279215 RepID=UPI000AC5190E|nr:hypothetical protein [Bacillus alveayuensis]
MQVQMNLTDDITDWDQNDIQTVRFAQLEQIRDELGSDQPLYQNKQTGVYLYVIPE